VRVWYRVCALEMMLPQTIRSQDVNESSIYRAGGGELMENGDSMRDGMPLHFSPVHSMRFDDKRGVLAGCSGGCSSRHHHQLLLVCFPFLPTTLFHT
jgi:hypothetical protein